MFIDDMVLNIYPTFVPERWSKGRGVVDLEAYAIEFSEADSYMLAGPYKYEDKYYGLLIVTRHDEQRTLAEILQDLKEKSYSMATSTVWMPYSAAEKVKAFLGKVAVDYYRDPQTGIHFSELDLKYGLDELDPMVVQRAKKNSNKEQCGTFWRTKGALNKILDKLTFYEVSKTNEKIAEVFESSVRELSITGVSVEKPWRIYLTGNDDSSWTKSMATKEEVDEFIENIKSKGLDFVQDHMAFTN